MDNKVQDILLLMLSLSKIDNSKKIVENYIDSMNLGWSGIKFSHIPENTQIISSDCIPLKTVSYDFGFIEIMHESLIVSVSTKKMLLLTIQMLAIIMENQKQHELLSTEKEKLQEQVKQQFSDLQRQEEQYRALAENSEDIIIRLDTNFNIVFINRAVEKIANYDKNNLINHNVKDLKFILEDTGKWIEYITDVFATGVTCKAEFNVSHTSGQRILDVRIIPEFDKRNIVTSIICSARDITELKQKEEELQIAKRKAEESDYLKSSFLANMSHEIRTPLNGILGFSQLLKKKDLQLEKRHLYSDIINNNGRQLLTIISDIIDISKIEAGQIVLEETEVEIQSLLQQLYVSFQNDLALKNKLDIKLSIKNSIDSTNIYILTDEVRLKQVLQNLISNAIKFTHHGSITFGIDIQEKFLQFYVKDTGIGLSCENQKIIFDRFRQANESTTREYGGTGLGLAIARNLIELMGGKIWVDSIEKKGTTFYFTLPIKSNKSSVSQIKTIEKDPEIINMKGKRILVVEDDIYNFNFIEAILEETKAKLIHVDNGLEAVEVCQKINPDLILMDIQLPLMNGFDAIEKIRSILPKMKIIVLTANGFGVERKKYLEIGCSDYLFKPVTKEKLFNAIYGCLGQKKTPK